MFDNDVSPRQTSTAGRDCGPLRWASPPSPPPRSTPSAWEQKRHKLNAKDKLPRCSYDTRTFLTSEAYALPPSGTNVTKQPGVLWKGGGGVCGFLDLLCFLAFASSRASERLAGWLLPSEITMRASKRRRRVSARRAGKHRKKRPPSEKAKGSVTTYYVENAKVAFVGSRVNKDGIDLNLRRRLVSLLRFGFEE